MTVKIQNIGGIYYINGKRLGHDILTDAETNFLNDFIKEMKFNQYSLNQI